MSNVNIRRAVENIGSTTSIYTPIVETVVNAIQAIESARRKEGKVTIRVLRAQQLEMELDTRPDIVGFRIEDNALASTRSSAIHSILCILI